MANRPVPGVSTRSPLAHAVLGLGVLLLGVAVYVIDRGAAPVYFLAFLPPQWAAPGLGPLFGPLGNHLPTFAHVYALIVLSPLVLGCRVSARALCGAWFSVCAALELAQHAAIATVLAAVVPAWFSGVPFLENVGAYLAGGVFDPLDMASIAAGALVAYATLRRCAPRRARLRTASTRPLPIAATALVAVALATAVGSTAQHTEIDGFAPGPLPRIAERNPVVTLAEGYPARVASRGRDNDDAERPMNPFASTYDFASGQLSPAQNLAGPTPSTFVTGFPSVVVDESGNGASVWAPTSQNELYANRLDPGSGWGQRFLVASGAVVIAHRVAMDGFGRILVVWLESGSGDLRSRGFLGVGTGGGPDGWTEIRTVASGVHELGDLTYVPTIGHVVWRQDVTAHTSQYDPFANTWTASTPISHADSAVVSAPRIALHPQLGDGGNRPVAVWQGAGGIYYHRFVGGLGAVSLGNVNARRPVVAMAANEQAIVAWDDGSQVMAAHLDGTPSVESLGAGNSPRLGMDAAGNAVVVWRSGAVVRARRFVQAAGWREPVDIAEDLVTNGQPEVAMDDSGRAIVVWEAPAPPGTVSPLATAATATTIHTYVFANEPVAEFSATPSPASTGDTVTFDASASSAPAGTIVAYAWDFDGDGAVDASGVTAQFVYGSPGDYTVRLVVTDDAGRTDAVIRLLSVLGAGPPGQNPAITTSSLPGGTVGQPYGAVLAAQGGTPPYLWAVQSGSLPPGTSLNAASGEIAGAPSLASTFNFVIEVRDDGAPPRTATRALGIAVANPVPVLMSLVPAQAPAGGASLLVDVQGAGFVPAAVVLWNGSLLATTFDSATLLRATVRDTDIVAAGVAHVQVRNPAPGGGDSGALPFSILNPVPVLTALLPSSANAGSGALQLTAFGASFVPSSVVRWGGSDRSTTVVGPGELRAQLGAADLQFAANVPLTVFNPLPGGGASAPLTFVVNPSAAPPLGTNAGVIGRISVSTAGVSGNGASAILAAPFSLDVSDNGDIVAFQSDSTNLHLLHGGVFVRRVSSGVTRQVSQGAFGATPNGITGEGVAISGNGAWVAFVSRANNLVPGDTSDTQSGKIFVTHSCLSDPPVASICPAAGIEIASLASDGTQPNAGGSDSPQLSFDGNRVVFGSNSNLETGFGTLGSHVWLRDRQAGTTELISGNLLDPPDENGSNMGGSGSGYSPRISRGGRFVAFVSEAPNLVADDTNSRVDVFVRDTCHGGSGCTPATYRISIASDGDEQIGGLGSTGRPDISDNGRHVVFDSDASNLVPGHQGLINVYLHDRLTGNTTALCPMNDECHSPSISGDGRLVSFERDLQVWVHDTCIGASAGCTPGAFLVSRVSNGPAANAGGAEFGRISGDGSYVVFTSGANNLVPAGSNNIIHVYESSIAGP